MHIFTSVNFYSAETVLSAFDEEALLSVDWLGCATFNFLTAPLYFLTVEEDVNSFSFLLLRSVSQL